MALFSVVPELRVRGFQINLAAWYPWQNDTENHVRVDSCGIFRIGPCRGIRMCFSASVLGIGAPDLPDNCSMVMEIVRDAEGNEIERRGYVVPQLSVLGQGYPLTSYRPSVKERRDKFVAWTCTPVFDASDVREIIEHKENADKGMFPFSVNTSMGSESWTWPEGPVSKQKLVSFERFDPKKEFFKRGAHMPLMIYIGDSSETRRSKQALKKRAEKADSRGWGWQRRESTKAKGTQKGQHGKGKGQPQKGGGKSSSSGSWG